MKDLIERLNKVESSREVYGAELTTNWYRNPDGPEAADLIQSQQSRIKELEGALETIRDYPYEHGQRVQKLRNIARTTLGDKA